MNCEINSISGDPGLYLKTCPVQIPSGLYLKTNPVQIPSGLKLYNLYASWVDYKSYNDEPLKKFDDLPEKIQIAWNETSMGNMKLIL